MNRPLKSMADVRRMLGASATLGANLTPGSPKVSLTARAVQNTLTAQVGQSDLGTFGNLRARLHRRSLDGRMQRTLDTARAEHGTALMLEKLHGEVEILRTQFKQDFHDRIAALAESAAASQVMVVRKLKAIEAEARNFVFHDLKAKVDDLQGMLNSGVIDEATFIQEASFRVQRYDDLKDQFSLLIDGYQSRVANTFQGGSR